MSALSPGSFVLLLCLAATCAADEPRLTFGVKGGVRTLEGTRIGEDESRRYIVGANVEYALWEALAVEANFLYRRNGATTPYSFPIGPQGARYSASFRTRAHVFELPILGKYYFRREERTQPFVSTGFSFRKTLAKQETNLMPERGAGRMFRTGRSSYWTPLEVGATVGGGLRWRRGSVWFVPEFRYTYWSTPRSALEVTNHQADFLFGITF